MLCVYQLLFLLIENQHKQVKTTKSGIKVHNEFVHFVWRPVIKFTTFSASNTNPGVNHIHMPWLLIRVRSRSTRADLVSRGEETDIRFRWLLINLSSLVIVDIINFINYSLWLSDSLSCYLTNIFRTFLTVCFKRRISKIFWSPQANDLVKLFYLELSTNVLTEYPLAMLFTKCCQN